MPVPSWKYETVAASQTGQVLGTTGSRGDIVNKLVISVSTAATSTVTLIDNATSIVITPANTPVGVYTVDFGENGIVSASGAWSLTTGAGATVIALGEFS